MKEGDLILWVADIALLVIVGWIIGLVVIVVENW